jgi:MoxR-like ATPase
MQSETAQHTLTLPWVESATQKFVFAAEMRKAFSLALVAGVNLIFSGPGGHAKSEFLEAAMAAIQDADPYVKSFGQGTSSEELYGGIDLNAMNGRDGKKATFQYNPEQSFLSHPLAVFEELFDAPPRVLTSLKDTLTARELRNGHQRYPMATTVIAAATNHSPQEIAEGGPEIAALVERFPVQLEVKWDDYNESAFMTMFGAVLADNQPKPMVVPWDEVAVMQQLVRETTISKSMQRLLARILAELRRDKVTISPRTGMQAIQLVRAAAVINDRHKVISDDINAIAFLPGVHRLKDRVESLILEYSHALKSEEAMDDISERCSELLKQRFDNLDVKELDTLAESWENLQIELTQLTYESSQASRFKQLSWTVSSGARGARGAIGTLERKVRDAERVYEQNATRLKEIMRETKSFANKIWRATPEEREDIELELACMHDEIREMSLQAHQLDLRDKASYGIEQALNKRP